MNHDAHLFEILAAWRGPETVFFIFLTLTSVCAWLRYDRAAYGGGILSLVIGYASQHIAANGAAAIILFAGFDAIKRLELAKISWLQGLVNLGHLVLAMVLYLHWMPGFLPWQWLPPTRICGDGVPFVSYLNADKILVGSLLLMAFPSPLTGGWRDFGRSLLRAWKPAVGVIVALLAPAVLSGFVRFEPQAHSLLPLWMLHNLLLVILHEEVMFRGLLPATLQALLPQAMTRSWALLIMTSVAFGAYHYTGGITYAILSACAGVGYELARRRAGRLEGAMMAHLALNVVHFIGFTYPSLARGTALRP